MLYANVFIDWNCFSGEQCGPWASCCNWPIIFCHLHLGSVMFCRCPYWLDQYWDGLSYVDLVIMDNLYSAKLQCYIINIITSQKCVHFVMFDINFINSYLVSLFCFIFVNKKDLLQCLFWGSCQLVQNWKIWETITSDMIMFKDSLDSEWLVLPFGILPDLQSFFKCFMETTLLINYSKGKNSRSII